MIEKEKITNQFWKVLTIAAAGKSDLKTNRGLYNKSLILDIGNVSHELQQ